MRTLGFAFLGSVLSIVAACGSDEAVTTSGADPNDVEGDGGRSSPSGESGVDASASPGDGGPKDAAVDATDASDAGKPFTHDPPSGYVACGAGSFTDVQARTACVEQGTIISTPASCDEAIGGGGTYEMFCKDDARWIRVTLVDVALSASATSCPSKPSYSLSIVAGQTRPNGAGWGAFGAMTTTPSGTLDDGKKMAITVSGALKPEHTRIAIFTLGYPFTAGCSPLLGARVLRGTPWFEADP